MTHSDIRRHVSIILFICTVASLSTSAQAQRMSYKDFWLRQYTELGESMVRDTIMPVFQEKIPPSELKKIETLQFFFPRSFNPYETYAQSDNGVPQIFISGFLIQLQFMYYEALGLNNFFYNNDNDFNRYAEYLMKETVQNIQRIKAGKEPEAVSRYWDFLDISMEERRQLEEQPELQNFLEFSVSSTSQALAYVTAHEIGHVVHDHIRRDEDLSPTQRRQIERDADHYAIDLMEKADFLTLAAGPFFLLFGMFDQDPAGFSEEDLYDRPWCRALLVGNTSAQMILEEYGPDMLNETGLNTIEDILSGHDCKNQ